MDDRIRTSTRLRNTSRKPSSQIVLHTALLLLLGPAGTALASDLDLAGGVRDEGLSVPTLYFEPAVVVIPAEASAVDPFYSNNEQPLPFGDRWLDYDNEFGPAGGDISLVSMFQDEPSSELVPDPENVAEPLEPIPAEEDPIVEEDTFGEEPEDYSRYFLRRQTVLLRPGDWRFDIGLTYAFAEDEFPLVVGPTVVRAKQRQRLLLVPLELRYGLTRGVQLFVNVPFGWSNTEFSFVGLDEFASSGGIGDVSAGATMLLRRAEEYCPEVVGTVGFIAPTGEANLPLVLATPESRLGEGFWSAYANLLFIHTYDPVVLFYGFGARYRFENTFDGGVVVDPGPQFTYQLGVGFAVNDRITLSTAVMGSYYKEDCVNGVRVPGTIREPMRLRLSTTIRRDRKLVEPFAEIGFTNDATSGRLGIEWTY